MDNEMCLFCGEPLAMPEMKGPAEDYCKHCTDESGKLKPHEEVVQGIAHWLQSWQPGIDQTTAVERAAGHYMKAMPAWAEQRVHGWNSIGRLVPPFHRFRSSGDPCSGRPISPALSRGDEPRGHEVRLCRRLGG
ncbi:MAG: hypothetical protein R6V85_18350 [Polyangia bacterium]